MKIKLWTIQDEQGWNELQSRGKLIPKAEFLSYQDFIKAYDWLKDQMIRRIGNPVVKNQYPVWAWYHWFGIDRKRPDFRSIDYRLNEKGTILYRIEIVKEKNEVLLSDFNLWHMPLNGLYIADSEKENDEFEKLLPKEDFNQFPKLINNKIEKSWEKIFDMNFDLDYYTEPFEEKRIQATFWELKLDEVVKVDKFKTR